VDTNSFPVMCFVQCWHKRKSEQVVTLQNWGRERSSVKSRYLLV